MSDSNHVWIYKSCYYLGWCNFQNGDTAKALSYFSEAEKQFDTLKASSTSSEISSYVPRMYYMLGKINMDFLSAPSSDSFKYYDYRTTVLSYFNAAINEDKYYPYAYFGKGLIYYKDQYFDSALSNFNMAIILDNKIARAYYFRALCEKRQNPSTQSICEDFKKAIKYQNYDEGITDSAGLAKFCK